MHIDLNADVGEGFDDAPLFALVTSVNIACGGHAGDAGTMDRALKLAQTHGLAAGAHPGYPDRENFGRLEMHLPLEEVRVTVRRQIEALLELARARGMRLTHVKPHGALYNQAARELELARAIAAAVRDVHPGLHLVGLAGSSLLEAGRRAGLEVHGEGFADRRYRMDGSLAPRTLPGAVIEAPVEAAAQALAIAQGRPIATIDSAFITVPADTICIHGDSPHALEVASAVHAALTGAGAMRTPPAPRD